MTDTEKLPDDPTSKEILEAIERLPYDEPSPGFDSKLRARLDEIDAARPWWARLASVFTLPRVSIASAVGAAAVLIFVVVSGPTHETRPPGFASLEVLEIAEDLDLYENYDLIEDLDVLDDIEVIESLDEAG